MSRMGPLELLLANFKQEIPKGRREHRPKAQAYASLKRLTGKDFGEDFSKWEDWINKYPDPIGNPSDDRPNRFLLDET
ncbi:hypothetical protein [Bremerella cremea]|uniref:hypothetical protein n=1 Tax=Bremerella cremea TaxID=1031537 RepID=UPI0011C03E68|nr:hypothetical protein [Bremerella cremea]